MLQKGTVFWNVSSRYQIERFGIEKSTYVKEIGKLSGIVVCE